MPSIRDELEIIRLVVAGIEKHARGDVTKLATGIIAELRQAGFDIVRRSERIETEKPVTATT